MLRTTEMCLEMVPTKRSGFTRNFPRLVNCFAPGGLKKSPSVISKINKFIKLVFGLAKKGRFHRRDYSKNNRSATPGEKEPDTRKEQLRKRSIKINPKLIWPRRRASWHVTQREDEFWEDAKGGGKKNEEGAFMPTTEEDEDAKERVIASERVVVF